MSFLDKAKDMAADAVEKVKDVAGDAAGMASEALHSEKAEELSDKVLDKVNHLAKDNPTVKNVTAKIDSKLGNE